MKLSRAAVVLLVAGIAFAGCGPQVPPVGNYATVYGVVVDATSNAPISGAQVTVNIVSTATTDANGNFRITTIPNGPWQWVAHASNYQDRSDNGPATLLPGEQRYLAIQLQHS